MSQQHSHNQTKWYARLIKACAGALARMPLRALYLLSDVLFVIMAYVVRYRRKVVTRNLRNSFPEATGKELRRIRRRFYSNFSDYIFETVKLLHISSDEMKRRMVFSGEEIADSYLAQGRQVVVYFSHCGCWEWAPSVVLWSQLAHRKDIEFCQVYRPLRSKVMDKLMLDMRSRFGTKSIPKRVVFLDLLRSKKNGHATMTGFMSDQKPSHGDPHYQIRFLNQTTQVITGTETLARKLDAVVVYWDMHKIKRGHYRIDVKLITDSPNRLPEHAITDRYFQLLQQTIRRRPDLWLWSHNRWKPVW